MNPKVPQAAAAGIAKTASADHKQIMAFDALSKLTAQFADAPDTAKLIKTLTLTVSGQFSVANVFVVIRAPGVDPSGALFWATGRFQRNSELSQLLNSSEYVNVLLSVPKPLRIEGKHPAEAAELFGRLAECDVELIAPLVHGGRVIGLIGLGEKFTRRPYDDDDISLLESLAKTVTPLFVNSLLFLEIVDLNEWHLRILNNVRQGVFVFDPSYRLHSVNSAGMTILRSADCSEVASDDVRGLLLSEVFCEEHFPGWSKRILRAGGQRKDRLLENVPARLADAERIFNVKVSTILRRDEPDNHLIITADDITEQKDSEHRLFDLAKLAEKGTMASAISHELNNYLGFIMGGVGLTQMAVCDGDMERAQKALLKIQTAIEKMTRFTAGLMDYGKLSTTKSTNDLNQIVADVLGFVTIQKKFMRLEIASDIGPDLPPVDLDGDQIAQLLINLLNNAADAIAETEERPGLIQVDTAVDGEWVVLRVTDNGAGMSDDAKAKLFKARFTTKEKGHGYGLVTCGTIIENHGGRVQVDSAPGEGTSFVIRFPIRTES